MRAVNFKSLDAWEKARKKKPRRKADDGMTEKTLAYLATQHDVWAERRNSGYIIQMTPGGGRYRIFLGEDGTPDVCGKIAVTRVVASTVYVPMLVPFGIETKCKGGKLNPKQRKFHEKAAKWGMPVCVAETLEDVKLFLERLRQ